MKPTAATITAAAIVLALAACGGTEPQDSQPAGPGPGEECRCACAVKTIAELRATESWPMPRAGVSVEDACKMNPAQIIKYMMARDRCQGMAPLPLRSCRTSSFPITPRICTWMAICPAGVVWTSECWCRKVRR